MQVIIDRFENNTAIVELPDGAFAKLDAALVPAAKEGDFIRIEIDPAGRKARESEIKELMDKLFQD